MSTENNEMSALDAMLAQYETNNKPKFTKSEPAKVYDLKNYFNTYIEKGIKTANKEIRILPSGNGTPFAQMHGHKIQVEGEWKTFACLKHENDEPCPFCEAREELMSTGEASDKELAKKFNAKLMYIAKVIDRNAPEEGVKFWRFNHDYRKEGIFDKIHGLITGLKKDRNIADPNNGRDLILAINRNMNDVPVVSSIVQMDASPLSEDPAQMAEWLADERTWRDVYSVRNYEYLEIIVLGGVPMWDKELKKFVDKNAAKVPSDETEEEITMGLETVKSGIEVAKTADAKPEVEDEADDLPF